VTLGVEPTEGWSPTVTSPPSDPSRPPFIESVETVLLPRVLEAPAEAPSLTELAKRHGLRPASARPPFFAYLGQLWRFRQFISTYANGRAVASLGTTRLGRLWQILSPMVNAAIYFFIFGILLKASRGIDNFVAYLTIGVFLFHFTQSVVSSAAKSISGQLGLVRALHFPRASLPIASTLTHLQTLAASVVVLAGIVLFTTRGPDGLFDVYISIKWLYLLPALALQFVFNLGLAMMVARLGAKIPDLRQLLPYALRVWMYASGVLYSASVFAEALPAWAVPIVHANPMLVYIELGRYALMDNVPLTSPVPQLWIMGGAWALMALVVGFVYFWRGEAEYGRG
jgi:teichoic acid transport system permease protein